MTNDLDDDAAWRNAKLEYMGGTWQSLIPPVAGILAKHSLPGQTDRWSIGEVDGRIQWVNRAAIWRIA